MLKLVEELANLAAWGCSDGYCVFRGPAKGMHTNGGCHCLNEIRNPSIRARLRAVLRAAREVGGSEIQERGHT